MASMLFTFSSIVLSPEEVNHLVLTVTNELGTHGLITLSPLILNISLSRVRHLLYFVSWARCRILSWDRLPLILVTVTATNLVMGYKAILYGSTARNNMKMALRTINTYVRY